MRRRLRAFSIGLVLGAAHCDDGPTEAPRACTDENSLDLFEQRIAPLLSSERQSSCNECHLAGVDLGLYAQSDPCATMACMVESGIVDLDAPDDSLVLDWILRADPASALIDADVIEAEHAAVREWIEFNSRCGAQVCAPVENPCGGTKGVAGECDVPPSASSGGAKPFDDPGDCSDRTLEAGFAALVYSWRGRCFPCHFDSHDGAPEDAPRWVKDGECSLGSLLTMREVVASGLLDPVEPSQSLLLLKPLAVAAGGVEHGGHDKMAGVNDAAYLDYLKWIERWAQCQP